MVKAIVKRAKKGIEEVVQYAVGHKIRVHVLIALNEGIYTASELSEITGVQLNTLHNHLRRMLDDGSIEIAREERRGNMTLYWYRAVEVETYTAEEFERLPHAYRQNIDGAIVQSGTAEVMAGLYAGTLADPRATVYWTGTTSTLGGGRTLTRWPSATCGRSSANPPTASRRPARG